MNNLLIYTPFTKQTGERGILMRYIFYFKNKARRSYDSGEFLDVPEGVIRKCFKNNVINL